MFQNIQEIKDCVSAGEKVLWNNSNYEVIKSKKSDLFLIRSKFNNYCFGLTDEFNAKDFYKE